MLGTSSVLRALVQLLCGQFGYLFDQLFAQRFAGYVYLDFHKPVAVTHAFDVAPVTGELETRRELATARGAEELCLADYNPDSNPPWPEQADQSADHAMTTVNNFEAYVQICFAQRSSLLFLAEGQLYRSAISRMPMLHSKRNGTPTNLCLYYHKYNS